MGQVSPITAPFAAAQNSLQKTVPVEQPDKQASQAVNKANAGKKAGKTEPAVPAVPSTPSSPSAPVSVRAAGQAAANALSAGRSIVSSLKSASMNLSADRLYDDLSRLMKGIEDAVKSAAFGRINFISSASDRISIRNGANGGWISAATQPLDLKGLGLTDLLYTAQWGPSGPHFLVQAAVDVASERVLQLGKLHRALSSVNPNGDTADPMAAMMAAGIMAAESRAITVDLVG